MNSSETPLKIFGYVPFHRNRALHLVLILSSTYILFQILLVLALILSDAQKNAYLVMMLPNTGLGGFEIWKEKMWTTVTYALAHKSFWELATNALWLFIFSSILQILIDSKEILIAFFVQYLLIGLLFPVLTIWAVVPANVVFMSALPAAISMGSMALVLAWNRKVYIGFPVPFWLLFVVFLVLALSSTFGIGWSALLMYVLAAAVGLGYGLMLKAGRRPGVWLEDRLNNWNQKLGGKDAKIDGWKLEKFEQELREAHPDWPEELIQDLLAKVRIGGIAALSVKERGMIFRQ